MLISDLVRKNGRTVITLDGSAQVAKAAQVMNDDGVGAVVIVDADGRLEGVFAERDVVSALTCGGAAVLCDPICKWMRRKVPTVVPQASVPEAMALITMARARRLPVMDGERVIGLLSVGDLLKSRLDEKTLENLVLQDVARWPRPEVA